MKKTKLKINKEDKICYMDKVDFDHELGNALGGNQLFVSVTDVQKHKGCCNQCGIVRVAIRLIDVIQESDFSHVGKFRTSHQLNTVKMKESQIKLHQKRIDELKADIEKLTEEK